MNFDLFKKTIDDLAEFDSKIRLLHMHGIGEPLLNPDLSKMIKYAKDSGNIEKIDIHSNAVPLTHKMSDAIVAAGLDFMVFTMYGIDNAGYMRTSNSKIDINKIIDNIKYFYQNKGNCEVHIKSVDKVFNDEKEQDLFYKIFGNHCDSIWIDTIINEWADFKATTSKMKTNIYGENIIPSITCPQLFYNLSINPDGTIKPCILDWKSELILGNVKEHSLKEVWKGKTLRDMQIMILQGRRMEIPTCSKCDGPESCYVDKLDNYRINLLKRYTQ
jgi:radical SAM protein with 4Fe4S-binding SPASM domain